MEELLVRVDVRTSNGANSRCCFLLGDTRMFLYTCRTCSTIILLPQPIIDLWINCCGYTLYIFNGHFFYSRRRLICLDEPGQTFVVRFERHTTKDSSFKRIVRLAPVFILETHNQTNNKWLLKFVRTDNASLV